MSRMTPLATWRQLPELVYLVISARHARRVVRRGTRRLEGPLGRRKTGSGGGRLAGGKSPAKSNSKTRLWSGKVFTVKWNLGAKGSGHLSTGASRELSPAGFLVSTRCCITPLTGLAGEGGRRGRDVRKGHKRGHMAKFSELATVFWGTHQRGHGVSGATEWRPLSVCRSRL